MIVPGVAAATPWSTGNDIMTSVKPIIARTARHLKNPEVVRLGFIKLLRHE
jgi:hypothetical protein